MIIYSLLLALLILLLVSPLVIRNIIKRSIDYFDFKFGYFNYIRDILAIFPYDSDPIIQRIAIKIPSIKVSYSNKRFLLKINQLRLFLDLKENQLTQIDGFRNTKIDKSKILKNIETILRQIIEEYKVVDQTASMNAEKRKSQYQRSKSGVFNFILMVFFQVVELQVDKLTVAIIENKNQQPIQEFKQEKTQREITQMFKLFKTNRRYKLTLPEFNFSTLINKDEKLEFIIKAKNFYAELKNDFTKKLDQCVVIEQPQVNFHMPFGFTSDDCLNESKIYISTSKVTCEFSPATCNAYKYIKYFRAYQARLLKFIRNDLVVKEKPQRSPMPKLIHITVPIVEAKFFKLDNEISEEDGYFHGEKCQEVSIALKDVKVQVITKLHEYITIKEIVQVDFDEMNINAHTTTQTAISLCHFLKGSYYTCRDYELKSLKILKTLDKFNQQKSEIHIHPIAFQLYEAYININQRPYLEFDFELYKTCLQKYIEECKKKYLQEIKISSTNNSNAVQNQSNSTNQNSNPQSNTSGPALSANNASNQNVNKNQNNNSNTIQIQSKELKFQEYLIIDDKILLETILSTENVLDVVTIPYLEQEFQTDFAEMYSFCGDAKISLTSEQPRYSSVQKEENSEYQGNIEYTFNKLNLKKFFAQDVKEPETIFTMDYFKQDINEKDENIVQKMQFMLLDISIKEETFKDVLDIKNNFDIDYLDAVRQRKFVNPYQPPDPFTRPQITTLDFNQFKFLYEFNDGQTIKLSCDSLGKNSEGILKLQDQKTTLKGIKLIVGMRNQCDPKKKQYCEKNHKNVWIEDPNLFKRKKQNENQQSESQQNEQKLNNSDQYEIRQSESKQFDSRVLDMKINEQKQNEQKQKNEDLLPPKVEQYSCDCDIKDTRQYDIFQIQHIEYAIKTAIPQTPSKSEDKNQEYQHQFENYLTFDTLSFRIHEDMKQLTDYFQDLKESINRVKDFSLQLNLKFPKKEQVVVQGVFNQMFKEPFTIQWNNLSLIIEESSLNTFNLNYQAFVRDYLQKELPYNERHILLTLNEKKRRDPLVAFYCKSLILQLNPLKFATNFEQILKFILEVDDFADSKFNQNAFESFNSFHGEAGFVDAQIKMRDYPNPILLMKQGKINLQVIFAQLKILNKSKSLRVYYNLLTEFGDFDLTVGLCQASGINELLNRFKELSQTTRIPSNSQTNLPTQNSTSSLLKSPRNKSESEQASSENIINRPKQSASVSLEVPVVDISKAGQQKSPQKPQEEKQKLPTQFTLPYWDNIRLCYHGKILMSKDSVMNFNLLTNIYPYQQDHLKFTIEQSFFMIREDNIKFYCQDLSIKRKPRPDNESHVLKIPLIQAECELDWNREKSNHYIASVNETTLKLFSSKKLNIFSKLNLPRVEPTMNINQKERNQPQKYSQNKLKRIVKNSEVPFIHYQVDFINWITSLPQLRREQLYLYKIGIKRNKLNEDQFKNSLPDFSDDSDDEIPTTKEKGDNQKDTIKEGSNRKDSHQKSHHKGSGSKTKHHKKVEEEDDEQEEDLGVKLVII